MNALNNLHLKWMSEGGQNEFNVRDEHETQNLHNKYFAFWEHRSKIRASSVYSG